MRVFCGVTPAIAIALVLGLASAALVNLAYLREHAAATALPPLSLRRPLASLRVLLADRRWIVGFAMETVGFGLYVAALALAPLALVQSVGAGGIGARVAMQPGYAGAARRSASSPPSRLAPAPVSPRQQPAAQPGSALGARA